MFIQSRSLQVIRAAQAVKGVRPGSVAMLEMHGTGTSLGDPIEVGAAFAVLQPPVEASGIKGAFSGNLHCHLGLEKDALGRKRCRHKPETDSVQSRGLRQDERCDGGHVRLCSLCR